MVVDDDASQSSSPPVVMQQKCTPTHIVTHVHYTKEGVSFIVVLAAQRCLHCTTGFLYIGHFKYCKSVSFNFEMPQSM